MPELPEVETVRRTLLPHVVGQRIDAVQVVQPSLRWPVDVAKLTRCVPQQHVLAIRRRAKYLLFDLESDIVLAIHLGMTGRLWLASQGAPPRLHDHVIFNLNNALQLRFNDARRFGSVDLFARHTESTHPRFVGLGVEPLDPAVFSGDTLYRATRKLSKPIKNFLMDAHRIVGVGNIYACEALFAAGIHPNLPAGRLSLPRARRLATCVVATLEAALARGGTTVRNFVDAMGKAGDYKEDLHVYGRQGAACRNCQGVVRRQMQAGRSTFYCAFCQRR